MTEHTTPATTTSVTLPERTVQVLDRPYTATEYLTQSDIGQWGEIERVVALTLPRLLDGDYNTTQLLLAEAVVSELGDEWEINALSALGPDPREGENLTLFWVSMSPGLDVDDNGNILIDGEIQDDNEN